MALILAIFAAFLVLLSVHVYGKHKEGRADSRSAPFRAFASKYNLKHRYRGKAPSLTGVLFGTNKQRRGDEVTNVVDGKYKNHKIKLFAYLDKYTVVQLLINNFVPHILLRSISTNTSALPFRSIDTSNLVNAKSYDSIGLELYATKGYEVEALQLFTDDIIAKIGYEKTVYCVDVYNGKVFFYAEGVAKSLEQIEHILDISTNFLNNRGPILENLRRDFHILGLYFPRKVRSISKRLIILIGLLILLWLLYLFV